MQRNSACVWRAQPGQCNCAIALYNFVQNGSLQQLPRLLLPVWNLHVASTLASAIFATDELSGRAGFYLHFSRRTYPAAAYAAAYAVTPLTAVVAADADDVADTVAAAVSS